MTVEVLPNEKPNQATPVNKKVGKETFSIKEIIRCYNVCLSTKPPGTLDPPGLSGASAGSSVSLRFPGVPRKPRSPEGSFRSMSSTRSKHVSDSNTSATNNLPLAKAASIAAATRTITAAAEALADLPSPKRKHIHRRSIIRSKEGSSFNSPAASFHSRRSSLKMTLNKVFQPTISSQTCTIPSCSKRRHIFHASNTMHSSGANVKLPPVHMASLPSQPKVSVYIEPYLDGFRELCKLLKNLGTTMSFATDNLTGILKVMDWHLKTHHGGHYTHVEMMIKYETTYKLVMRKISGKDSGTKSILQLHRTTSFLIEFIKGLKNANSRTKSSSIAQQAFDSSIAKYYSWLISSMASMAFSSLPSTQECLTRIANGNSRDAQAQLKDLLEAITPVYNRVQEIYCKHRQLKCA